MKVTALIAAAALAGSATVATAGGLAPVVMEEAPVVVVEPAAPTSSLGQFVVPAILLGLIALAATAESDSDSAD